MHGFKGGAAVGLAAALLLTAPNASAQDGGTRIDIASQLQPAPSDRCAETSSASVLRGGLRTSPVGLSAEADELAPRELHSLSSHPSLQSQVRDVRGIPWVVLGGAALLVGGALVDGDVGTLLMVGGVASTAYGLFIYF